MADIIMKNIKKVYPGNVTAVKDFSLEIEDKEFVVLVGPSGCGKSSMLRMIAGLEEITDGELSIGGHLMNDVAPKDRDIAMVFQNYALYPHMTIYKNMAFALTLRKISKAEIDSRVRATAQILGIEHLLLRKPKALSGGERQRAALGRAMVRNPAVFLLDEPLSNLDAKLRTAMRTELIKLHNQLQTTFVYVTHDQTEAMTMGDRIVVMRDGLIQQVDTPQRIYDNPCNIFVAGFIGSPPMNFIDAILISDNGEYYIQIGGDKFQIASEKFNSALGKYAGKVITIGIRPENICVIDNSQKINHPNAASAVIEVSEPMGSEIYLYLNYANIGLVARVPPGTDYKTGTKVNIWLDSDKFRLFDPETEQAI